MSHQSLLVFIVLLLTSYITYKYIIENYTIVQHLPGCKNGSSPHEMPVEGTCHRYSGETCCNSSTSHRISAPINHLGMNFDVCGGQLSPSCRRYFENHFCLQTCDPYLMPYHNKLRNAIVEVPICDNVCRSWYSACSQELFCVRNLVNHFVWKFNPQLKVRVNQCPSGTQCQRVNKIYSDHVDFCETMFNSFYKVSQNKQCVVLDFDPVSQNPNAKLFDAKTILILSVIVLPCQVIVMLYQAYKFIRSNV